jgi:hypothetical protein
MRNGRIVISPPGAPEQPAATSAQAAGWGGTAADVAKGAGTGLVRGVEGLIGLPGDLSDLVGRGVQAAGDMLGLPRPPAGAPKALARAIAPPTSSDVVNAETALTGGLHEPQTRAAKYAETIASLAPGALAGPGSTAGNLARFAVAPGAASEAAGELTGDNPWARNIAAILTAALAPRLVTPIPAAPAHTAAGPQPEAAPGS